MYYYKLDDDNYLASPDPSYHALYTEVTEEEYNQFNNLGYDFIPEVKSISMRQTRLKLLQMGILDLVEQALVNDRAMQIEWEYAAEVLKTNPLVLMMASQFGLTQNQIDLLFYEASLL